MWLTIALSIYWLLEIAEDNDPALADRIELRDGETNLFDVLGIEDDINAALSRKVWLKSGAYLVSTKRKHSSALM